MVCRNCGTEHNGKFCPNCGTPSSEEPVNNTSNGVQKAEKSKKSITKRWWFWVILAFLLIGILGNLGSKGNQTANASVQNKSKEQQVATNVPALEQTLEAPEATEAPAITMTPEPTMDLSAVAQEYTLAAGNYIAGIDIPAGRCNVVAVKGNGNVSSSNMYDGGLNEVFGINDGSDFYTSEFTGLKLPDGTTLTISGGVTIQLSYTKIESSFSGRTYNEEKAISLKTGNYESGVDFDPGTYKIVAVSGTGNISSSNMFEGGVNEVFGVDDGDGWYVSETLNIDLPIGTEFEVSGGVTVKLIPSEMN